jgi:hypothetical protein
MSVSSPPRTLSAAEREQRRQAALTRWGGQRVIRIDSLPSSVRDAVIALVNASEQAAKAQADG